MLSRECILTAETPSPQSFCDAANLDACWAGPLIHPASLVNPAFHSPALTRLGDMVIDCTLIEHVADTVEEVVDYALELPHASRGRPGRRTSQRSTFLRFVTAVLHKASVTPPVLLVAIVYIERAKAHLEIVLERWAKERIFLGALILANKYLNDSVMKNVGWARCIGTFDKHDIGVIEREFLDIIDFDLSVSEAAILAQHSTLAALSAFKDSQAFPHQYERQDARSPVTRALH